MTPRIGIDLGGTKIEGALVDAAGTILERRRVPTPQDDYPETLRAIADLVRSLEAAHAAPLRVGVGTPGAISARTGAIKNANSTVLIGKHLKEDLERVLERTIRITNDANCFALSESNGGAASETAIVFGVILGTGVGGGIVANGAILDGANAIAGEWGHNPLPWPEDDERPGPACYCGKHGCIETFCCGPALTRQYAAAAGDSLAPTEIAQRAQSDQTARTCIDRYLDRLARALGACVNVLDPDVIVFGGGVSRISEIYGRLPELMRSYVFSDTFDTALVPARFGDSSGVRGAALLWNKDGDGT